MRLRRVQEPTVNVNARFARMSSDALGALAEHSLMNAGEALSRMSQSPLYLDEAIVQTNQALQALRVLQDRV